MINVDRDLDFKPAIKNITDKLNLMKSDIELLIKSFDKVMKDIKKVK